MDDPSCSACDQDWFACECPPLSMGLALLVAEMLDALPPDEPIVQVARKTLEHLPSL